MAYNTIKVKKFSDIQEEFIAAGTIYPGMLVEMDSAGKVVAHNSAAARHMAMIASRMNWKGRASMMPMFLVIPFRCGSLFGVTWPTWFSPMGRKWSRETVWKATEMATSRS